MDSGLSHKGVQVFLTEGGLFWFEVEDERFEVLSYREAKEKIDRIKRSKRKALRVPCWMVIDDGDDAIPLRVIEAEYCGIHAGWNAHTYRVKEDRERHAANTWRPQEIIFPTNEDAEAYANLLREIERLTQECEAVGFRLRRGVPGDYDARGRIEQEVVSYLTGGGPSPDAE